MIYILIALALFGFLTMTLSRQNTQSDNQNINDEELELIATEMIEYVASTQQAVDMLIFGGSELNQLNFVNPSSTAFDTPPHIHKVFHPHGGGINYQDKPNPKIQNGGASVWAINDNINVEWTQLDFDGITALDDVLLTAYFITRPLCEVLNKKITGSKNIPVTASPHADYFLSTGNQDLTVAECAGCEGYPSLCVENNTNNNYSFYNIIATKQ